ncbi:MAG: hypothetical protein LBI27_10500, partial [Clostridiales bacterium]|nr:hypothetical protein [Clostridiales bacterium]
MVISHNVPALFTHLSMRRADRGLQAAMTRLSSGMRINSAKDDAAGLAIANKLNYQVGGLNRASENSTHGISLIQTAEGALNEIHNMLQRMRELSVQAAHGTLTDDNRAMVQLEIEQLTIEIHSISRNTEFNRMRILNGEANRVVDNALWNATLGAASQQVTRNIVSTLYVSPEVPAGNMNYTITQAGRPAMMVLTPTGTVAENDPITGLPTGRMVFPPNSGFSVNGVAIDMSDKTWEEVIFDINEKLPFLGMSLYEGTDGTLNVPAGTDNRGTWYLVTNLAGRDHSITLTGVLDVIGMAGVTRTADTGVDALVTMANPPITDTGGNPIIGGLVDVNGNPVAGASLAASATGNYILIRGSQGEDIRMNIQVEFNPGANAGEFFRFPGVDGFPISELEVGGAFDNGLHMSTDFRDFGPIMLQIGSQHNTAMPVQIPRVNSETLVLIQYVGGTMYNIIDVRPTLGALQVGANAAIKICDAAILTVSDTRARLGAYQNRLESTVRNLDVAAEN